MPLSIFGRGALFLQYQKFNETYGNISGTLLRKYLTEKFNSSKWLYSKDLVGHTGCVNALAFSKNGGEFLVSGGDDKRILVWKLREAVEGTAVPRSMKCKHQSNIFCVNFDHDNKLLITAGNDEIILCHDFESGELVRSFEAEANTNEICLHPEDNNIFIAAESSFGEVTLFDLRTPTEQTVLAVPWPIRTTFSYFPNIPNFSSAKFNPVDPTLIATGNLKNGVQLWDTRFPKRCLRHFDPSAKAGREIAMSVDFDYTGRYVAAVRKAHPPVLYHIDRDTSLVEFCEDDYGNTVTRKSVSFAGQKDEFIMTGSEDFNVYLWKVPKLDKDHVGIAKVEHSSLVLKGHRSIVNQVYFNRDTSMICSSGIEKIIKIWSPFPMVGGVAGDKRFRKRKLYTHDEYYSMLDTNWTYDEDCTGEDEQMLAMVDQWILKPHENTLNDSESDDEPPIEHVGVFVDEIRRENLYLSELDSEISESPENTDFENEQSSESDTDFNGCLKRARKIIENLKNNLQNDGVEDTNSENTRGPGMASHNTTSSRIISQNAGSSIVNSESAQNANSISENRENQDRASRISDGVGLERLREIISSQDRPRNSLGRIAELRRNCLKDDSELP